MTFGRPIPAALAVLAVTCLFALITLTGSGHAALETRPEGTGPPQASALSGGSGEAGKDYVPGEVLVTFKEQATATRRQTAIRSLGGNAAQSLAEMPGVATVRLGKSRSVAEAVRAYRADPTVKHAQPNFIYRAQKTPNDPNFGSLWGMENTGQTVDGDDGPGVADRDINATGAWDTRTDCTRIPVAVLDTGINYQHADLAGNMWTGAANHGRDFVGTNDNDPIPDGGAYHGTHVAGTIAAVGDNGEGVAGVCWQAEIMAVRVLGSDATGTTADIIEGINYAVNQGAKIINMSLGGGSYDPAYRDALADARDQGVLVVAAAGNGGSDSVGDDNDVTPIYPCSFDLDNIVCVAALDQKYDRAGFSNFGDVTVDVGAPGTNINSTWPGHQIEEDLSSVTSWDDNGGDWATNTCTVGGINYDLWMIPSNYCPSGETGYGNNADARIWKEYDLSDSSIRYAGLSLYIHYDTDYLDDYIRSYEDGSGGDPVPSGTILFEKSGNSGGFTNVTAALSGSCLTSSCAVGFQFDSDGSGIDPGVRFGLLEIRKVVDGATALDIIDGTSMATPHVAGIAALAWAAKPGEDMGRVRQAVLESGDRVQALDGITTTGRAADAKAALAYVTNEAPSVDDASLTTTEGSQGSATVSAQDPEGDSLTWSVSSQPANGTASVDASGTVTFDPVAGFTGDDSFAVEANDGYANSDTGTVSVTVNSSGGGGGGSGGGGGCTLSPGSRVDPIWGLLLVPWAMRRLGMSRAT